MLTIRPTGFRLGWIGWSGGSRSGCLLVRRTRRRPRGRAVGRLRVVTWRTGVVRVRSVALRWLGRVVLVGLRRQVLGMVGRAELARRVRVLVLVRLTGGLRAARAELMVLR
ncbi:hypothetical protein GCM10028799_14080 [Kribbella italica]